MGSGMIEFTVKHSICGLTIMVRRSVPDDIPGEWIWGRWRRANKTELAEIMKRLTKQ